ncbi:MAG: hypothetical protein ACU83N_05775 [Gammaproteobacteria bacterium]
MPSSAPFDKIQSEAAWLVHACALANGGIAFGLANTLAGDSVLITGISLYMIHRLGKLYQVTDVNGKQIVTQIVTYYTAPLVTAKLLFWLPGIGNWANAASMSLLTEIIGWSCILLFAKGQNPEELDARDWKKLIRNAKHKAHEHRAANKAQLKAMTTKERKRLTEINQQLADSTLPDETRDRLFQDMIDLYAQIEARIGFDQPENRPLDEEAGQDAQK